MMGQKNELYIERASLSRRGSCTEITVVCLYFDFGSNVQVLFFYFYFFLNLYNALFKGSQQKNPVTRRCGHKLNLQYKGSNLTTLSQKYVRSSILYVPIRLCSQWIFQPAFTLKLNRVRQFLLLVANTSRGRWVGIKLSFRKYRLFVSLFIQPHSKNNTGSRENGRWELLGYIAMVTRVAHLICSGAGLSLKSQIRIRRRCPGNAEHSSACLWSKT